MTNYSELEQGIISNSVANDGSERVSTRAIPEDWDKPVTPQERVSGAESILQQKMNLPRYEKPMSVADRVLSTKMNVPNLVEEKPVSYIPEDWLDELPKPISKEPSAADVLLKTKIQVPTYVKPESAVERLLRTPVDASHLQVNRTFSDALKEIREQSRDIDKDYSPR